MVEGDGLFENITLYVKWFNATKGYGFATNQEIPEDVFVHFSLVQSAGKSNLKTGDKIICNIANINGHYQATKIISIVEDYENTNPNILNKKQILATLKWFNYAKGYGFANDSDGNDIFLHKSIIQQDNGQPIQLLPGKEIFLDIIQTTKGLEAVKYYQK